MSTLRPLTPGEALLRQVLDSSPNVIFAVDPDHRLLVSNQAHQRDLVASGGRPLAPGEPTLSPDYPPDLLDTWRGAYDRALGGETFIHANAAAWGVSYNSLDPGAPNYRAWLHEHLVGARRFR